MTTTKPLFPFDLERAKNGEPVYAAYHGICKFESVKEAPIYRDGTDKYRFSGVGTVSLFHCNEEGNICNGERVYMISPDPKTVPAGAREKFENSWGFKNPESFKGVLYHWHNDGVIVHDIKYSAAHYCFVLEIRDWGFLAETRLFGETFTKWVEFKDITFV